MELAELVSDVVDITDPACMEKLLDYYDELQARDDYFMQLLVDKVKDATITWNQPWYQESRSLTRPPTSTNGLGENNSETFRTDRLTKEENDILEKNWKKFTKTYGVPKQPESFARWRNRRKSRNPTRDFEKARNFVTAFLAQGLERTLYKVYMRFVARYAAPVRGPFTKTEKKIMAICFYHKPDRAVPFCATILGREPRGISTRLHMNNDIPEIKRIKWSLPAASKMVQSLIQHSELPFEKLKYVQFETSVWRRVQEDMDHSYYKLRRFWYYSLHAQLYVKCKVRLKHLQRKILKRLKKSYNIWTDIRWNKVVASFPDGFTSQFLYRIVHKLVRKYPGSYRTDPLSDVVTFALECLAKTKGDKCLQTLTYDEEGNLDKVKYDEEGSVQNS